MTLTALSPGPVHLSPTSGHCIQLNSASCHFWNTADRHCFPYEAPLLTSSFRDPVRYPQAEEASLTTPPSRTCQHHQHSSELGVGGVGQEGRDDAHR